MAAVPRDRRFIAQFAPALFAYRARDGVATAMPGAWGGFWMALGMLGLLAGVNATTIPTAAFPEFGSWFLVLVAITGAGAVAAFFAMPASNAMEPVGWELGEPRVKHGQ